MLVLSGQSRGLPLPAQIFTKRRNESGTMIRLTRLRSYITLALSAALLSWSFTKAAEQPNILFILTDDMGYGDVGCYGGRFVPTPHIDQLAREGTRFTEFYVASPVCSPSRTGFLTGCYPARWKITNFLNTRARNRASEQVDFLDPKAPSMARTLKAAGYATGMFGKWHMGGGRDVTNAPPFREYGFDEHASTYESPEPDPNLTGTNWIWSAHDRIKRWDRSAYFVDKTLDFLQRHQNQPCYVNLWPDDVHTPWVPQGTDLNKHHYPEKESTLKPVLAEYDKQIGRLMAGLKELKLDQNTIVIFTSDNGPLPTLNNARTRGLRGAKDSLYEGGTREPLIVRWPGHAPAGRVDGQTIMNAVDFFPTFCKLAGTPIPHDIKLDGEDLSASFSGHRAERKLPMFWEYGRNETFGYPREYPGQRSPNLAIRDQNWKLLVNADSTDVQLYDLASDRNETRNVAARNPEVTERLTQTLLHWRKSLP